MVALDGSQIKEPILAPRVFVGSLNSSMCSESFVTASGDLSLAGDIGGGGEIGGSWKEETSAEMFV